ncbi:MAG: ATP-binding cassette domain-containing protein [Candidatus Lokiarchaeota archaeon]|nr:ATP-binding cassette domain-containing protein [Candidatus Lokiarchaeota archaeon]
MNNFSFIYGDDKNAIPVVSDVSFKVHEGETLVIAGPSGSGKSTISYALNGAIPWRIKGFAKGQVEIMQKNAKEYKFFELSKLVGLVSQNPLDQLVTFNVYDEIAFGLENLLVPKIQIESEIEEIAQFMGIHHLLEREIDQLSGGQMQLVLLSSFLVMKPRILILDEPMAYLDQKSESLLLEKLKLLKNSKNFNLTLIIIEHRLSRVLDLTDKILVLDVNGKVALKGKKKDVIGYNYDQLRQCNLRIPWMLELLNDLKENIPIFQLTQEPIKYNSLLEQLNFLNQEELMLIRNYLYNTIINPLEFQKYDSYEKEIQFQELYIKSLKNKCLRKNITPTKSFQEPNDVILDIRNLFFQYPNSSVLAINGLSFTVERGDFIGLVGPNGAGKTTLLYVLANLYKPTSGEIYYKGNNLANIDSFKFSKDVGFIFQNPENMIFKNTIQSELLYGPENFNILEDITEEYIQKLMLLIGEKDENKNPFNLSWGQKRRLNLSSVFIYDPEIILLDEPFIGQDQRTIDFLIETLYIENKRGKTIIISSHDYQLLLKYTKKIMELNKDGSLRTYENKEAYFKKHKNLGPIQLLEKLNSLIKE